VIADNHPLILFGGYFIGKDILFMNITVETPNRKPPHTKKSVIVLVEREFMGNKTLEEIMLPIIIGDLRRKAEQNRSFDTQPNTA
jgi:hypothetical protein